MQVDDVPLTITNEVPDSSKPASHEDEQLSLF